MHTDAPTILTPRRALRVLLRHKKKFGLFFLLVMTGVSVATFLLPSTYRSEGKLFVRLGRENVGLDATATLGQASPVAIPHSREDEMNSVVELLRSRTLSEAVVDAIGPEVILGDTSPSWVDQMLASIKGLIVPAANAPGAREKADDPKQLAGPPRPISLRDRAIAHFEEEIGVATIKNTNIISLAYDARSPQLAQAVLDQAITRYVEQHVRVNRTPGAHEFLATQTTRLREQLSATEDQLRELKYTTGVSVPQEQERILVARLGRLEDELLQTDAQLSSALAEAQQLRASLQGVSHLQVIGRTTGLENSVSDGVRQQLYDLQLQEQELLAKYTDEHWEVQQVRRQIEGVHALIAPEPASKASLAGYAADAAAPSNAAQADLVRREPVLAALDAKAERLRKQLNETRAEMVLFEDHQLRIARLEREVALQDASYRKYAENLEQSQLDLSLEAQRISNINVVEAPTYNAKPVRPKKLLNLAMGFAFALAGGVGLVLLAEFSDHSIRSPQELEQKLGVPALVTIPQVSRRDFAISGKAK